ncbi:MAG: sodium-dependent transporter, partial [Bacteroidales bacterium]
GMGCIITYGSYVNKKENLFKISFMSAAADTGFAILAGLAVIPAVFAFGISPGEGPSLVFITLPQVFAQLPFGQIVAVAFFFILLIAALTSSISLLEVVVAFCCEELKWSRLFSVIVTFIVVGIFGSFSSLSQGVLSHITVFSKTFFDFFDYTSSNILLPIGGLLVVLLVGWRMKRSHVLDELTSGGTITVKPIMFAIIYFLIRFVAPIAIITVLIHSLW